MVEGVSLIVVAAALIVLGLAALFIFFKVLKKTIGLLFWAGVLAVVLGLIGLIAYMFLR